MDRSNSVEGNESQEPENKTHPTHHHLRHVWVLWATDQGKAPTKHQKHADWKDQIEIVSEFFTVEEFWCIHAYTHSKSPIQSDYLLFKKGILPAWEDPKNVNGGRWVIKVPLKGLDDLWLCAMLCVISGSVLSDGSLEWDDHIAGAVVSPRRQFARIALWVTDADPQRTAAISGKLFDYIRPIALKYGAPDTIAIEFEKFWK